MRSDPANDPGAVWRNQPGEKTSVNLQNLIHRRTREFRTATRSEILISVAAALFFIGVVAMRFPLAQEPRLQIGFGAVIAWALITVYRFRSRMAQSAGDFAATGVEHYRRELERRRDHLRNAWLWQGPIVLATVIVILNFAGKALPDPARLQSALPLVVLLALWVALGFRSRRRRAKEIQREIEEIDAL